MSNAVDEFTKKMEQKSDADKQANELREKELILKKHRVNNDLQRLTGAQLDMEIAKNTSFGPLSEDEVVKMQQDNLEYIEAARNPMKFINDSFDGVVPFFRKNLILIGGKTGEGKSTTVANIVLQTIKQINPITGKRRRALVITNEEKREDFYNRITCLGKGWAYTNHDKFTPEQVEIFHNNIKTLSNGGLLTVVDDNHGSTPEHMVTGITTTVEGISTIFDNLIRDKEYYDVVIIDYYQNIKSSKMNYSMNEWEVQAELTRRLDKYKNIYPAPIVVMAQVQPPDEDNKTPFEYRIKGRKVITDPATLIIEMVADRENLRTLWVVHKSRFTESVGKGFHTGFDRGRFVPYDMDFIKKVNTHKENKMFNETVGKHVFKNKKEDSKNEKT